MIAEPPFLFKLIFNTGDTNYDVDKLIGIGLTLIAAVSFAVSYVILRALKGVHVDVSLIDALLFS